MTKDAVDYVRQGAFIALAMVLIQRSGAQCPEADELRANLEKVIAEKHEETMTKFGCILAEGILNAGGRNVTIALHAPSGHKRMAAVVGLALFSQYWYWYPLVPLISLAFSPTAVIGLNKDLNMPVTAFKSNARPELFAYPPMKEIAKKDVGPLAPTAVLSITEKAKKRDMKRTKSKPGMDVEEDEKEKEKESAMEVDKEDAKDAKEGEPKEGEQKEEGEKEEEKPKDHEILQNPARVTIAQREYVVFDQDERYRPVRPGRISGSGVILLTDSKPDDEQVIVESSIPGIAGDEPEEDEPEPPEPFEYSEYM
jgi:26S proteasome regulatory subunit N2